MGVKASCDIESGDDDDPTNAVVRDELGQPFTPRDERIQVLEYVARTGQATPNETRRPVVPKGWTVDLTFHYMQNEFLQESTFRKMIEQGGVLGLGTFRPIFGRFAVEFLN